MVSGFSWHEAVAAASVAGSLGAPVLMTPPHEVQDDALDFLDRVGASSVLLVSTDTESRRSIDAAVDEQLRGAGLTVERIGGADQYQTGVAVAERLGTVGELGTVGKTAIIASGEVFADALVAGPLSARAGLPVLLTSQAELHDGGRCLPAERSDRTRRADGRDSSVVPRGGERHRRTGHCHRPDGRRDSIRDRNE